MSVRLRPLLTDDFGWAYRLAAGEDSLSTFRFRGWTPNPERIGEVLFDAAHVQLLVESDRRRVGLVTSYRFDPRNRTTRIAVAFAADASVAVVPAVVRLLRHLFDEFPLRHVYFEGLATNLTLLTDTRLAAFMHEDARLVGAEWHNAAWIDTLVLRLTRERFAAAVAQLQFEPWERLPLGFGAATRSSPPGPVDPRCWAEVVKALDALGVTGPVAEADQLRDIGVDSLMLVELVSALEVKFDVEVLDEDLPRLVSVGDLACSIATAIAR